MSSKKYQDAYNRRYYIRNRKPRKAEIMARLSEIKREVDAVKLASGCSVCGYKQSAWALEFHHTGEKENNIGRMVGQGRSLKSIFKEARKCVILCANCHAEEHERLHLKKNLPASSMIRTSGLQPEKPSESLGAGATLGL